MFCVAKYVDGEMLGPMLSFNNNGKIREMRVSNYNFCYTGDTVDRIEVCDGNNVILKISSDGSWSRPMPPVQPRDWDKYLFYLEVSWPLLAFALAGLLTYSQKLIYGH